MWSTSPTDKLICICQKLYYNITTVTINDRCLWHWCSETRLPVCGWQSDRTLGHPDSESYWTKCCFRCSVCLFCICPIYKHRIKMHIQIKYYITFATSTQTACSLSPSSQVAPSDGETGVIHQKTHILVLLGSIAVVMCLWCLCKVYMYNFDQLVEPVCEFIFTNEQFVP